MHDLHILRCHADCYTGPKRGEENLSIEETNYQGVLHFQYFSKIACGGGIELLTQRAPDKLGAPDTTVVFGTCAFGRFRLISQG